MDNDYIPQKCKVIYRYKCDKLKCDEEYIGESRRTFRERLKEHLRAPSPIYDTANTTGNHTSVDNFPFWIGSQTALLAPSRNPCLLQSMIHHSTETLGSTSCPTYGMTSCQTPRPHTQTDHTTPRGSLCLAHNLAGQRCRGHTLVALYH